MSELEDPDLRSWLDGTINGRELRERQARRERIAEWKAERDQKTIRRVVAEVVGVST